MEMMAEMRNPKMSRAFRQEMNAAYGNARKIAVSERGKPRFQKTGRKKCGMIPL